MITGNLLVQLTENDKRFIIALLLVIILLFVICGFIGMWIVRLMKWQGKKMDTLVHDVVVTKVITNKKHLGQYGRKKNWRLFFFQSWLPLTICFAALTLLLVYDIVNKDFSYNPFDLEKGFGSLFFTFEEDGYWSWFIFAFKKYKVAHWPTFKIENWCGYIFCPLILVGGVWYLVAVQAFIARSIRLYKLRHSVFEKSLEGYSQSENPVLGTGLNPIQQPTNQNNNQQ